MRSLCAEAFESAPGDALLFVNLHPRDLLDEELYEAGSPLTKIAERVVLEITERAAIDDVKDIQARVAVLRYHGFRIAIDDLGAGYAGLSSFVALEPEIVKLDMSLVRDVHRSDIRQRLIGSMATALQRDGDEGRGRGRRGERRMRGGSKPRLPSGAGIPLREARPAVSTGRDLRVSHPRYEARRRAAGVISQHGCIPRRERGETGTSLAAGCGPGAKLSSGA